MTPAPVTHPPILVAIDEGEDRHVALEFAVAEAEATGRGIEVVHVVHPLTRTMRQRRPHPSEMDEPVAEHEEAEAFLASATALVRADHPDVTIHAEVREGLPLEAILAAAQGVDRVFLQRRHLSALDNVLNGPVVAGVAAHAPVPVVVVPEAFSGWDLPGRRRITVALKRHAHDGELLSEAFRTASRMQAGVRVLRVLEPHRVHGFMHGVGLRAGQHVDPVATDGLGAATTAAAELRLLEELSPWRARFPEVPTVGQVVVGRPVLALLEATADSDLLLISRPPSRLRANALGTLSRALIREAVCPVEVVPTRAHVPAHVRPHPHAGADSRGPIY